LRARKCSRGCTARSYPVSAAAGCLAASVSGSWLTHFGCACFAPTSAVTKSDRLKADAFKVRDGSEAGAETTSASMHCRPETDLWKSTRPSHSEAPTDGPHLAEKPPVCFLASDGSDQTLPFAAAFYYRHLKNRHAVPKEGRSYRAFSNSRGITVGKAVGYRISLSYVRVAAPPTYGSARRWSLVLRSPTRDRTASVMSASGVQEGFMEQAC
jgi:hypothetical protein